VSNSPGISAGNLQSLLEIFWFSLGVRTFVVNIGYNFCILECIGTKCLAVNQDQLILRLAIPGKCKLTYLLIW